MPASNPPATAASDLVRQQLAVATEGGAVLYRGFEAMRRIQEQAARQALRRHAEAAGKLRASARPADVLALQSELLKADIEDATRCWQQLLGEAFEINSELLGCATRLVDTEGVFAAARLLHS